MFKTTFVEKIETELYIQYINSESRAVYEIMWKNMVDPDRPQLIQGYS